MHAIYLESLAGTLASKMKARQPDSPETRITTKQETGSPAGTVCNLVERNDIGLIIMTATGGSGIKVTMLGSVAGNICRTAPVPVLLIMPLNINQTEGKKRLINRILLPVDGSSLSRLALPVAEELATRLDVPITLFQMARMTYPTTAAYVPGLGIPAIDYSKLNEGEEKWVRAEIVTLEIPV
jgi:nucleotide-binding universal stress UspA family protein